MTRPNKEGGGRLEKWHGLLGGPAPGKGGEDAAAAETDGPESAEAASLPAGEWVERGVYRMKSELSYGDIFGARPFENPEKRARLLAPWGAEGTSVFFDLETTGLSGGAGVYAFLAGIGICGEDSFSVVQLFLADPAWEKNWLAALEAELPESFGFVTYNGIAFDMPLLRARYTLTRGTPPRSGAGHMDLLYLTRHFYRKRLVSCSLSEVESAVLGVKRDGGDVPGREIPRIYADYLRTKDASGLRGVFSHNCFDIISLAALQTKLGELAAMENCSGEDLVRCGDLWYIMGRTGDAESAWREALGHADGECGANLRLADQSKRRGDFESAKKHLEQALKSDKHPLETLENLAKLEEHRFRNYGAALEYAERALFWLNSRRSLRDYKWSLQRRDVTLRIERLKKKLNK